MKSSNHSGHAGDPVEILGRLTDWLRREWFHFEDIIAGTAPREGPACPDIATEASPPPRQSGRGPRHSARG